MVEAANMARTRQRKNTPNLEEAIKRAENWLSMLQGDKRIMVVDVIAKSKTARQLVFTGGRIMIKIYVAHPLRAKKTHTQQNRSGKTYRK